MKIFLKYARTIRKKLFMFPYVDKMEEFIKVHYKHQGEFLLSLLISFNFNSYTFIYLKIYYVPFDYNFH